MAELEHDRMALRRAGLMPEMAEKDLEFFKELCECLALRRTLLVEYRWALKESVRCKFVPFCLEQQYVVWEGSS